MLSQLVFIGLTHHLLLLSGPQELASVSWCLATLRSAGAAGALELCVGSLLLLQPPPLQWGLGQHWGHSPNSITLLVEALTASRYYLQGAK